MTIDKVPWLWDHTDFTQKSIKLGHDLVIVYVQGCWLMGEDFIDTREDTELNQLIHIALLTLCLQLKPGTSCGTE